MGSERPTVTLRPPRGWTRAALAGIEAAVIGWLIPISVGVGAFWMVASNPWLRDVSWEAGAQAGGNFWALSLGGEANLGALSVSFWPLLWTIVQVVLVRVSLLQVRQGSPHAAWAAVPTFTLASVVMVFTSTTAPAGRTVLGAVVVVLIGSAWTALSMSPATSTWGWVWKGITRGSRWVAVIIIAGAIAGTVSAVVNHASISQGFADLGEGTLPFEILLFMFIPNTWVWAWSWMTGIGFIGPGGITVSPESPGGELPGIPYWEMVPSTAGASVVVWIPLLLGLTWGILSGVRMRRRSQTLAKDLLPVIVASLWFAALVLALLYLSKGSLGSANLSYLGPPVWQAWGRTLLEFLVPLLAGWLLVHPQTAVGLRMGITWIHERLRGFRESGTSSTDEPALTEAPSIVDLEMEIDGSTEGDATQRPRHGGLE